MGKLGVIFIGLAFLLVSCAEQEQAFTLESVGLAPAVITNSEAQLLNDAISEANAVLEAKTHQPLITTSWQEGDDPTTQLRLYTVSSKNLTPSSQDMLFVLEECKCLILQFAMWTKWLDAIERFPYEGGIRESGDLDDPKILALLLLHEAGHIYHGHTGRSSADSNGPFSLPEEGSKSKQQELEADRFVADALLVAAADTENFDRWMSANWIINEISKASFNLLEQSMLLNTFCIGCDERVADRGYSHPNLHYRFTILQALLAPDGGDGDDARALLAEFERQRDPEYFNNWINEQFQTQNGILYQSEEE